LVKGWVLTPNFARHIKAGILLSTYLSQFSSQDEQLAAAKKLAADHPYFTPAQFYLLLNGKEEEEGYATLAAKNSILFNNPAWLNFQLNQALAPAIATVQPAVVEETIPATTDFGDPIEISTHPEPAFENKELIAEPVEAPTDFGNPVEKTVSGEPAFENKELPAEPVEEPAEAITPPVNTEMKESIHTNEATTEPVLLKDILTQPSSGIPDELPAFQPLYTSDYFASQGIKLSEEQVTGDKLGTQLKSFTEWLKSMKKVHPEKLKSSLPVAVDNIVQVQAEKSNTEGEVVTEAMAEVLAVQGKFDKAAAVYKKLSLLNPGKSTYFAAKIEQLKRR
jgi:hypothetical protein